MEGENTVPHCENFWNKKYKIKIDKEVWKIAINATKETRLRVLHWKLIHNIYPTGTTLKKIKLRETELCPYCHIPDHIEHFFIQCSKVRELWKEVNNIINVITEKKLNLTDQIILTGAKTSDFPDIQAKEINKINAVILIAKMCIGKYKYGKGYNLLATFENESSLRKLSGQTEQE